MLLGVEVRPKAEALTINPLGKALASASISVCTASIKPGFLRND